MSHPRKRIHIPTKTRTNMKLILLTFFFSSALLCGQETPPLERAKAAAVIQWEYKVITISNPESENGAEQLAKLGLEGWELISVAHADGLMARPDPYVRKLSPHLRYYFKRQKAK